MESSVGNADGQLSSRFSKPIYNANPTGSDDPPIEVPNVWVDPVADKVYYKPITGYWTPDLLKSGYKWVPKNADVYVPSGNQPHMRRWVFDKWISKDEYYWTQEQLKNAGRLYKSTDIPDENTPPDPRIPPVPSTNQRKLEFQGKDDTEGFSHNKTHLTSSQITAGVLFAGLFVGLVAFTTLRK
jgi:hypothetical protein